MQRSLNELRELQITDIKPHEVNLELDVESQSRGPNTPSQGVEACHHDH